MAGTQVIDVNRNIFANTCRLQSTLNVRSIVPNSITQIQPTSLDVILTSSSGSVRSTASQSTGYVSFSNIVFSNPGKIVMTAGSNMYFGGSDGVGNMTYTNFAYQPLQPGTDLPGNSNIGVDVFVLNENNWANIIGNGRIAASTWEMVNPSGGNNSGATTFRIRNWDHTNVYNSAANASSNYVELKMDNTLKNAKLNTDRDLAFTYNDANMMLISGSQSLISVPGTTNVRVNTLSGTGVKPIYSDVNGTLVLGGVSDRRLKEQITDLKYGLDTVMMIQPVEFKWNSDYNGVDLQQLRGAQTEYGVIAQDIQQVIPDIVGESDEGTLYVDYIKLIPILIKSVQELRTENVKLMAELDNIKSHLAIQTF
jgi:hypothetical protein